MANIEVSRASDGKPRYRVRYRTPEGKDRSKTFRKKAEAQAFVVQVEASKTSGLFVDSARSGITVGQLAADWLAIRTDLAPSTRARYDAAIADHIEPRWKSVRLAEVRHDAVQKWVADLSTSGQSPASVRKVHRVLSLVFDYAIRSGRMAVNPAAKISLPSARPAEKVFLDHEQVEDLADACAEVEPAYWLICQFLAYSGLRWGRWLHSGSSGWTSLAGG